MTTEKTEKPKSFTAQVFTADKLPDVIKCVAATRADVFEFESDYDPGKTYYIVATSELQAYRAAVENTSKMTKIGTAELCARLSEKQ